MADIELDLDYLITLIEHRPQLWDKTNDLYKDRNATRSAWDDVFSRINADYDDLDDIEKQNFGRIVIKKWGNVRDSFKKCIKKRMSDPNIKPYIYHNKLQFLYKTMPQGMRNATFDDSGELEVADDTNIIETIEIKLPRKSEPIKRKFEDDDLDMKGSMPETTGRHMSFFQGILPSLNLFNEDEVLEFQMGVLQTISSIKKRKRMSSDPLATVTTSGSQKSLRGSNNQQANSFYVLKTESASESDFST